jgi:hypothetical protein
VKKEQSIRRATIAAVHAMGNAAALDALVCPAVLPNVALVTLQNQMCTALIAQILHVLSHRRQMNGVVMERYIHRDITAVALAMGSVVALDALVYPAVPLNVAPVILQHPMYTAPIPLILHVSSRNVSHIMMK